MQTSTVPVEVPCYVAWLVDSSLALSLEWHSIMTDYLLPLLKPLAEACKLQFRLGIITYATSDTRPSPIVSNKFFDQPREMITHMQSRDLKLLRMYGVGTSPPSPDGMAALEGYVAALEMFDILNEDCPPKDPSRRPQFYLFHAAAAPPDLATRPYTNHSPTLDDVSWESLPNELRKRNIHLNVVCLQQFPQFAELHAQTVGVDACQPWFKVQSGHALFLAGLPNSNTKIKREPTAADRSPNDAKRLKPSHPTPSPTLTNTTTPRLQPSPVPSQPQPPTTPVQPSVAAPAALGQDVVHPSPNGPGVPPAPAAKPPQNGLEALMNQNPAQFLQKLQEQAKLLSQQTMNFTKQLEAAKAANDTAKVQQFQKLLELARQRGLQITEIVKKTIGKSASLSSTAPAPPAPSLPPRLDNQAPAQSSSPAVAAAKAPSPFLPPAAAPPSANVSPDQPALLQGQQEKVSSASVPAGSTLNPNSNPPSTPNLNVASSTGASGPSVVTPAQAHMAELATQMQKMHHQRNKSQGQNNPTEAPQLTSSPLLTQPLTQPPMAGPSPSMPSGSATGLANKNVPVWKGTLLWYGSDRQTNERKDVQTFVVASSPEPKNCHAQTWPNRLTLSPHSATTQPQLQAWVARHRPALCVFQPVPDTQINQRMNENHFRSLILMLTSKNNFAVASWTTPSGNTTNNALLFPMKQTLAGVFFPLNGMPDFPSGPMPNPMPAPAPAPAPAAGPGPGVPRMGHNISPNMNMIPAPLAAQLAAIPQERRQEFFMQLAARRTQFQQQHQQQQQGIAPHAAVPGGPPMVPTGMQHGNVLLTQALAAAGMPGAPGAGLGLGISMNPMASMGQGMGGGMAVGIPGAGAGGLMPPGGDAGGMNYDMLQSFMQRTSESGPPPGPG